MKTYLHRPGRKSNALTLRAISLAITIILIGAITATVYAEPMATIALMLDPDVTVALLPGEAETITWEVALNQRGDHLQGDIQIFDQDGTELVSEIYFGNTESEMSVFLPSVLRNYIGPTLTPTTTPTLTPTTTPTLTPTTTPTLTPTTTPTLTPTTTPTLTPTTTPTLTPTTTPTLTPTDTPTPTPPPSIIRVPHPKGIAINEAGNLLYIASKTTNRLYEADGGTNNILRQVAVGSEPFGVAFNKNTGKIYVANYASGTVSVIDPRPFAVIKTIDMGAGSEPAQIAINNLTNRIYVTLHGAGRLAVIDGNSDGIITKIGSYSGPFDVVADEALNLVYMSTRDSGFVAVIDGASNTEIISRRTFVGGVPYSMALDPVLRRFYVVYAPHSLLVDPESTDPLPLYLPLPNALLAGDPNKIAIFEVKPNDFGRLPDRTAGPAGDQGGVGIAANPSTDNFFVSNAAGNSLTVFDGWSLSSPATLGMPGNPGDVAVNSTLNRVYISNRSADLVYMVVDTY